MDAAGRSVLSSSTIRRVCGTSTVNEQLTPQISGAKRSTALSRSTPGSRSTSLTSCSPAMAPATISSPSGSMTANARNPALWPARRLCRGWTRSTFIHAPPPRGLGDGFGMLQQVLPALDVARLVRLVLFNDGPRFSVPLDAGQQLGVVVGGLGLPPDGGPP